MCFDGEPPQMLVMYFFSQATNLSAVQGLQSSCVTQNLLISH